ncbi:MAG: VWA domain-containing protein [Chloroflexi bacterium]|nr:VWA domain-containing protein [Chloroflexota bacterium]
MAYQAEISRANPTCFFFLIDQSSSMLDPIMGVAGNPRKTDFVADALNKVIQTLIVTASKDVEVRRYYQIGALGYGGENEIIPAFGNSFGEQDLVWIDELYSKPLRVEDRARKESDGAGGFLEVSTKFPIWIDPVANGRTPMCQALERTKEILEKWTKDHRLSYPPTVINLTDGEANDGDPRIPANAIRELATADGNVILITVHASSNQFSQQLFFPDNSESLPDEPSRLMFEMASPITSSMLKTSEEILGIKLQPNARGFVYNAGIEGIVSALEIGTRPANLR